MIVWVCVYLLVLRVNISPGDFEPLELLGGGGGGGCAVGGGAWIVQKCPLGLLSFSFKCGS